MHDGKRNEIHATRRQVLVGATALGLTLGLAGRSGARAEEIAAPAWRHATALSGTPKYPADFARFDYVNPAAPRGGVVRLYDIGAFDSFNPILPRGNVPAGIGLIFETLMTPALDEMNISAEYGLLAEALQYPPDFSWVRYRLRPEAKWHDGQPVTADDVVWSFEKSVAINPQFKYYYSHVVKAEAVSEREVLFTFDQSGNRELPQILGQLTILPKHWWEGTDAKGQKRDINAGTLEPPLGSGPYRIKAFSAGQWITYARVPDHWGAALPVQIGQNNFDEIRYEVYRDGQIALEAFKGDRYDWRTENSAKNWATAYDIPAVKDGRIVLETFPDRSSGIMQAFVLNLRRPKFADPRVRKALNLAFDFETLNRTTFFGQYKRIASYFAGTELASSGLPEGRELEILETVRTQVPPEVFTTPFANPVNGDPEKIRGNLRDAVALLQEAGWQFKGRQLVDAAGKPFTIEYLNADPSFERVALPLKDTLGRIGITMTVRTVDSSQYVNLVRAFDFDLITSSWPQSLSPGNEQKDFWGSAAADQPGSRNLIGIKDPAIDALIDRVIYATGRDDLIAATRALDRVLLANQFVIPQWYIDYDRTARWNRFGHPETLPAFAVGFPTIWWWDAELAARTGAPK